MATLVCVRACLHFRLFLLCVLCVCLFLCVRQRGSPDWPRLEKRPLFDRNATGGCEVSAPATLMSAPSVCLDFFLYPRDKLTVFIVKGNYFTSKLVFVPRSDCSLWATFTWHCFLSTQHFSVSNKKQNRKYIG